jgi:hypothetical protein
VYNLPADRRVANDGFSLVETIVAVGTASGAVALAAPCAGRALEWTSRNASMAILAQQAEQLRAATSPLLSPGNTLGENTGGWVDYLDERGTVLGGGTSPPSGVLRSSAGGPSTRFRPTLPKRLSCRLSPAPRARRCARRRLGPGETRLATVRTRRSPMTGCPALVPWCDVAALVRPRGLRSSRCWCPRRS